MTEARAVVVREYGSPESFALESVDPGLPGSHEVRVRIGAAGISFADLLVASGSYQVKPPLPFIPGSEFAGRVEAIGSAVRDFTPGDYVAGSRMTGALAEASVVPATALVHLADCIPVEEAAVFGAAFSTAYLALAQRAAMQPGESVVILGAGGAVGLAGVQVAKLLGGFVVASASTREKRDAALAAGADAVIEARAGDWRERLQAALHGRRADIVYDPVGGDASEPALRCLGWGGRHLVIGFAGGGIPRIATNLVLLKGIALIGVELRRFSELEPEAARRNSVLLFDHLAAGGLKPLIAAQFPIDQFAAAMTAVTRDPLPGRVVLRMA